jgi:DNA-binding LytR/AlgR family response regulator
MKVLIIEDEAPAFRRLQRILEEIEPNIRILEVIDSVEDSVQWFKSHKHPDLIFMDIQLADGISFNIFNEVEISSPIIFTTAYDEYAIRAFKVNSIDYLLKPIDKELLKFSLKKVSKYRPSIEVNIAEILKTIQPESKNYKSRFLVKFRDKLLSIKVKDISSFYTKNGNVYLLTVDNNKYVIDHPLDLLENQLDPKYFLRLNRQHISNVNAIISASNFDNGKILVELTHKTEFPVTVSRDKSKEFKSWMGL